MASRIDGVQLLHEIARKDSDLETAQRAFTLFVGYFENKVKPFVEVHANRMDLMTRSLLTLYNVLSIRYGFILRLI